MARAASGATQRRRVDSHLHLWTPDVEKFPCEPPPKKELNDDGRATHENFVRLMDEAGVSHAVVVQPINYGQDYSYLTTAMDAHPARLRGMFVADPSVGSPDDAAAGLERTARSHAGWVGVRFNPYKWPQQSELGMADDVGRAMFRKAGELGLVVGFMPFEGLAKHLPEIEGLLKSAPDTKVVIDHWGFFVQPATGFGSERAVAEESWAALGRLSAYPQVHVKISALFRVSLEPWPFASLSDRLKELLRSFGSSRLLWGSDFPYATEFSDYLSATRALEEWPVWNEMSEEERADLLSGTASRLFALPPAEAEGADVARGASEL
mmetsp:Transcript_150269/g.480902  ORF Transcript_150269/g.480902 Transcript_150269/m.480902 type:complete len:323 (+) Transcript_150269:540-1508(+)